MKATNDDGYELICFGLDVASRVLVHLTSLIHFRRC